MSNDTFSELLSFAGELAMINRKAVLFSQQQENGQVHWDARSRRDALLTSDMLHELAKLGDAVSSGNPETMAQVIDDIEAVWREHVSELQQRHPWLLDKGMSVLEGLNKQVRLAD